MNPIVEKLESRLADGTGVYVHDPIDPVVYFSELAEDIKRNACEPFQLSATAVAPGFPHISDGVRISGFCVAKSDGYWLVYRPEDDTFYAFWGLDIENLGAPGIFGPPLYCWSA
jgi:hypothetical protein